MGKSRSLADLIATQELEVSDQDGNIILTAPVAFADNHELRGQIRLPLTIEQADRLVLRIQVTLRIARAKIQQRT
jgi:hypothetical protein